MNSVGSRSRGIEGIFVMYLAVSGASRPKIFSDDPYAGAVSISVCPASKNVSIICSIADPVGQL